MARESEWYLCCQLALTRKQIETSYTIIIIKCKINLQKINDNASYKKLYKSNLGYLLELSPYIS